MAHDMKSRTVLTVTAALAALVVSFFVIPDAGALPALKVRVSDTTSLPGVENTVISVFLDNNFDTIAGFNIWLQLDRPDILEFQTSVDTVVDTTRWKCIEVEGDPCGDSIHVQGDTIWWRCDAYEGEICTDSTNIPPDSAIGCSDCWGFEADWDFFHIDTIEQYEGNIQAEGTLTETWEWLDARSLSGMGDDLNIAGIADQPGFPFTPGIPPQQGGVLVRLLADVKDVPDTLQNRTVNILIQSSFLSHFNFARPNGTSIGLEYEERPDTNYWVCDVWAGETCMKWRRVMDLPADSTAYGMDTVAVVDLDTIWLYDGSLTVLDPPPGYCGDINGSGSELVDIQDLVYLVNFMFKQGPEPPQLWTADMQCSDPEHIDIADLVYLVNYMFKQGPAPCEFCP